MAPETADRYAGQPMLKVLDSYVLDALEALDDATRSSLVAMAPTLASTLGVAEGPWQRIVEQAMNLPPDSALTLQSTWENQVNEDCAAGRTPDVLAFAKALVDATFFDGGDE